MRHVNAIAENQRLSFSPYGMTVIYGDNGSGKSGYSRVFKRACRARDPMEAIHPNAALPASQTGKAEAVFEIKIDGSAQDAHWSDGKAPPAALSRSEERRGGQERRARRRPGRPQQHERG